jgi:hypothetical protein
MGRDSVSMTSLVSIFWRDRAPPQLDYLSQLHIFVFQRLRRGLCQLRAGPCIWRAYVPLIMLDTAVALVRSITSYPSRNLTPMKLRSRLRTLDYMFVVYFHHSWFGVVVDRSDKSDTRVIQSTDFTMLQHVDLLQSEDSTVMGRSLHRYSLPVYCSLQSIRIPMNLLYTVLSMAPVSWTSRPSR